MEDLTLSIGALTAFAAIVAQAVAARVAIQRCTERHDKRDLVDLHTDKRLNAAERWQRDHDVEARVRQEIHDKTPLPEDTREWHR